MGYDYGKIWVAGASGRVGTMIHNMLDMRDVELLETDVEELDITCAADVNLFGSRNRPNTIINCAGMTDVQECEDNIEQAYKVNALGARNLSAIARKIDARIIQISTDDIFWDNSCRRFHEFDTPNPRTVYGKSKLAGENFVKELAPKHLIIRSSWVYGKEGHNFVNSIIEQVQRGGIIEAAQSMGATTFQIIVHFVLPEAFASVILALTTGTIALIGATAMAGYIGGGGIGNIALTYGYQTFNFPLMFATVFILIAFVWIIQSVGNRLSQKRRTHQ